MIPDNLLSLPDKESDSSFLINPNLGHPLFLSIDPKGENSEFETNVLFISTISDIKEFERSINKEIRLVPILEYKWKIRKLVEEKEEELEKIVAPKEKRGLFSKIRSKFSRKKKNSKKEAEEDSLFFQTISSGIESIKEFAEEKFEKLAPRAMRADPLPVTILRVEKVVMTTINDLAYIKDEMCTPLNYFSKIDVFNPDFKEFYKVKVNFDLSKEVLEYLEDHNFVMFDVKCFKNRINYHSVVISKQDWKNFTFVQATDLHLAERNDKIYGIVKSWAESSIKQNVDSFFRGIMKKLKIKRPEDIEEKFKIPLRKRLINPNNQFRKFIRLMNRKVLNNQLDFIVLTGDLIDFTLLSKFFKSLKKITSFKYNHTNWKIFKDIVINSPHQKKYRGIIRGEELLCPIFTILGNHDYRAYHYDLTWAGLYKKMGLNASEAVALNEFFSSSPITAIIATEMALKGYLSEISPSFDYTVSLGNNLLIFLNSGSDSFLNIRDLISGHPSVTGLTRKQIKYLENLKNNKIRKDMNVFLLVHGPPINTPLKPYLIKRNNRKTVDIVENTIEDFKESRLLKRGIPPLEARIDDLFNVKYGCISSHWEKLISFCKDYSILTLAGHTHSLKEYRLEEPTFKTKIFDSPPFSLKRLKNPAAIYYDVYSELHDSSTEIEKHRPFIVQTPALGMGAYHDASIVGAYREMIVKEGKLSSFKVKYINRKP